MHCLVKHPSRGLQGRDFLQPTILDGTSPDVKGLRSEGIKPYILIQLQIAIVSITEELTLNSSLTLKNFTICPLFD